MSDKWPLDLLPLVRLPSSRMGFHKHFISCVWREPEAEKLLALIKDIRSGRRCIVSSVELLIDQNVPETRTIHWHHISFTCPCFHEALKDCAIIPYVQVFRDIGLLALKIPDVPGKSSSFLKAVHILTSPTSTGPFIKDTSQAYWVWLNVSNSCGTT